MQEVAAAGEDHGRAGGVAAAITSSSRIEPPGWTIARTPAAKAASGPSANGKNPSDASTAPWARSSALSTAMRTESTRLI